MKDTVYGSSNVLIRVYENDLLTRSHFERMLAAESFEEAVNILRESPYRNDVDRIKNDRDYDSMFMNELHQTFEEMFEIVPNKELVELFGLRYAYHNLKVLIKEEIVEKLKSFIYSYWSVSYIRVKTSCSNRRVRRIAC